MAPASRRSIGIWIRPRWTSEARRIATTAEARRWRCTTRSATARREDLRAVLAVDVAGRIVLAHPDVVAVALRVAAADVRGVAPDQLREMAGVHREAAVGKAVLLDLAVPVLDGRRGIERADRAGGEVL